MSLKFRAGGLAPDGRGVVRFGVERRIEVDQIHRCGVHTSQDRKIIARPYRLIRPVRLAHAPGLYGSVGKIVYNSRKFICAGIRPLPDGCNFSRFLANVVHVEERQDLIHGMLDVMRDRLMEVLPDFGRHLGYDGKAIDSHSTGQASRKTGRTSDPDADWGVNRRAIVHPYRGNRRAILTPLKLIDSTHLVVWTDGVRGDVDSGDDCADPSGSSGSRGADQAGLPVS